MIRPGDPSVPPPAPPGSRDNARPKLVYPPELPITVRRDEIVQAIRCRQVVVIAGETGCGKSTQIPKMCIEAGRGRRGMIAVTQPRRIAAVTIAGRIAEEMGEPVGRSVGYKIRFDDTTPRDAWIKVVTDGMLLAETQGDPRLLAYDTIVIDEAHERSLNIDFLLGIAKTLLPVRPDLRLIITSATLDIEKFRAAFDGPPIIEVGGRTFPVDVEYRLPDPESRQDQDYTDAAVEAVDDLRAGKRHGDILIFMPTEQDILETCEKLEGRKYLGVTVLPLFARLPGPQQGRVYRVTGPKIVVATNVAETSLTIPGIRYVVDTGLARISQYLPGARINSLPIRPISKSSADQRKGRCGRVSEGVCVRLYSEDDYNERAAFTPPEIQRSNLAEVILRMISLRLGHPAKFPFVDRPTAAAVKDGFETLHELGAIREQDGEQVLTETGRGMARMPLDPRLSRMLIEAVKEGCLREVAVIAAAMSIRDPRERPPDKAALADQMHAPFREESSDFLTLLNIWERFHGDFEGLKSQGQKRRFCHEHFLSYPRMREWAYVHAQILDILREMRVPLGRTHKSEISKVLYGAIHRSILAGILSNIAVLKEKNIYTAAKGREAMVFPGSALFNKSPHWIAAAEMVKTSRLFARLAARIQPEWLEELGGEMCKKSHSDPRYDKARGQAVCTERVTLFGLEIVSSRTVAFGPIDPEEAHRVFVREALVEGAAKEPFDFLSRNLALKARLETAEEKLRRRDILTDEERMAEFYEARLAGVFDIKGLRDRIHRRGGDAFLAMTEADLIEDAPDEAKLRQFPDDLRLGERRFRALYKFAPGEKDDGVTLRVPAERIGSVRAEPLEWGVPGQLKEKITELIRGLPKRHRKLLVPVGEKVDVIMAEMPRAEGSLFAALSKFVKARFRAEIPPAAWAEVEISPHLRMRVAVTDQKGRELAAGRDLEALKKLGREGEVEPESEEWKRAQARWEAPIADPCAFGPLPEALAVGYGAAAYPALSVGEGGVGVRLFKDKNEAMTAHKVGIEAFLMRTFAKDVKYMERHVVLPAEAHKAALFFGGKAALEKALLEKLKEDVLRVPIRSGVELRAYSDKVVRALFEKGQALLRSAEAVLEAYRKARTAVDAIPASNPSSKTLCALQDEFKSELESLAPKDLFASLSGERLARIPGYLEALAVRAGRVKVDPEKDRKKAAQVEPFLKALRALEAKAAKGSAAFKAGVEEFRWLIEEFKVAVFAPEVKAAVTVSPKRLSEKVREIEASLT
ncbi:MAG: ATP-dependent RNA helicase HrpA [Candidatus Aminicenantes bacterium]|nr:ATP-dependent RNA helicase HrpA [Candidatus Aminicenantes bacterium]